MRTVGRMWRWWAARLILTWCLVVTAGCGDGDADGAGGSSGPTAGTRLEACSGPQSGGEAAEAAQMLVGPGWQLAMLSNTGVTQQVSASAATTDAADRLMTPDGVACHWVAEFFKDEPTPVQEGGRTGLSYPFQVVTVWDGEALTLPESTLVVPTSLRPLSPTMLQSLPSALETASTAAPEGFDFMSAASFVDGDSTEDAWNIRYYTGTSDPVAVWVNADGTSVIDGPS